MRALHVAAGNLYGGVERILLQIARAGGRWDHEFALAFDGPVGAELEEAGAVRHVIGAARFSRPLSVWRARRALTALCARRAPDAVICHSPWSHALAGTSAAAAVRVLWVHDAIRGRHWTERHVRRSLPQLLIANSRYTAAALQQWLPGQRVEVVYAPVPAAAATVDARTRIRDSLEAPADCFVILVASRFERWKGHDVLLDAVARLSGGWQLWIAGAPQRPHETAYRDELAIRASALGISDRVRWLGARADVRDLLEAADVLCQPNTAPEPFGVAFVESLAAGRPVVTSGGGGASEIVAGDCGVLTAPGDVRAVADALQGLQSDGARRAAMGSRGRARAAALCNPATQVAHLEAVLENIAKVPA